MAGDIIAARLAGRLAPGLGESVAERLLLSPRLGARARAWAAAGGADALDALPEPDRALAAADEAAWRRAAVLAGAVWHARRVRGLVLARDLQAFIEAHGPEARRVALQHTELAPRTPANEPLPEAVASDGRACVAAWAASLPEAAGDALRLSMPLDLDAELTGDHRDHGPAIVRAVAGAALVEPPPAEAGE